MTYRLFACLFCLLGMILGGCSALLPDVDIPAPPGSVAYTTSRNANIDLLLVDFDQTVRGVLKQQHYKVMESQMFTTTLTISNVVGFYSDEMTARNWQPASNSLPDDKSQAVLAYQKNRHLFVVAALDTKKYRGPGVIIYTLQATK